MLTVAMQVRESPAEIIAFLEEAARPILEASAFAPGDAVSITPYPNMPTQWCIGLLAVVLMHDPVRQQVWALSVDSGGGPMVICLPETSCARNA